MSDDPVSDPPANHPTHGEESGIEVPATLFEEKRQVHELLSEETRHHIIQTILGHPKFLVSITEFAFYISTSTPTIHEQLDCLRHEDIVHAYELEEKKRKRNRPYKFYGLTEHGVKVLYEYKYLRGVPIMRAITDATAKPEKVERHQNAPRPNLPDAVVNALQYDEPDPEDITELEPSELVDEASNRGNERVVHREESERDQTETPEQDTGALDDLFQ